MFITLASLLIAGQCGVFSAMNQTMTYYSFYQSTQYDTGLGCRILIRGLTSAPITLSYYDALNRERHDIINFTASYSNPTWTVTYSINTSVNYVGVVGLYSTTEQEYVGSINDSVNLYDDSLINQTFTYEGSSTNVYFAVDLIFLNEAQYNALIDSDKGYTEGYNDGKKAGEEIGYQNGVTDGYAQGRADYENTSANINSIFNGILSIGLVPIEFFLSIFNFEIFGINITSIISAVLSMAVLVILLTYVLRGK